MTRSTPVLTPAATLGSTSIPIPIRISECNTGCYQTIWHNMRSFTEQRDANSEDQIWLVEHEPVYTQGQAGKAEHVLNPKNIPVIQTDRGGQVTYHGPGQLVAYVMIDLRRRNMKIRTLVNKLEQAVIDMLQTFAITANARSDAPGVYVDGAKICSLGLRVKRGCSYHGLALNVNMDLSPFKRINPCGFEHLEVTQISDLIGSADFAIIKPLLSKYLLHHLG